MSLFTGRVTNGITMGVQQKPEGINNKHIYIYIYIKNPNGIKGTAPINQHQYLKGNIIKEMRQFYCFSVVLKKKGGILQ